MTPGIIHGRWTSPVKLCVTLVVVAVLTLAGGCAKRVVDGDVSAESTQRTITHVIADGETLEQIADNYYGDPARAAAVAAANGLGEPERLVAGSSLMLNFSASEWELARRRAAAMAPYNRGVDFLQKEYLQQAEEEFRTALELAPGFVGARYNLALALIKRGQYDDARQLLGQLTAERPAAEDIAFALGHVLFLETRFAEAVDVFTELLTASPGNLRAAFGRARALQEAGHVASALSAWDAYLQLDADSSWADIARDNIRQLRGE